MVDESEDKKDKYVIVFQSRSEDIFLVDELDSIYTLEEAEECREDVVKRFAQELKEICEIAEKEEWYNAPVIQMNRNSLF